MDIPFHMQPTPTVDSLSPLIKLSPSVYLVEPAQDPGEHEIGPSDEKANSARVGRTISAECPKLVILVTWMSAQHAHISKYIRGYQSLYPTSRILVIRNSPPDFLYRPTSTQRRRVASAVSTIVSCCPATGGPEDPQIILHVFSNGGSHQTHNLLLAYGETIARPFPPHVTIFDSCPGRASFGRSVLALSSALPNFLPARLFLLFWIYAVVSVYWAACTSFGIVDPIERLRQAMNGQAIMGTEIKRCYVYSEIDPMVGWQDVEDHAHEAVERGFVVMLEKFEGTGHCAHVRFGEGRRYWAIVNALWRATQVQEHF